MMTALAKFKVKTWPYKGPVALIERDEFGMREDFHLVDRWRYLGTVHNEQALHERLDGRIEAAFDPDIYRIINKFLQAGKLRVLALPVLL
jgi:DNA polymerase-3 subunit epsilon